jgi:hypothetical protein
MKRAWIAAVLVFASATAGLGQMPAPGVAPLSAEALAAILDEPVDSACPKPQQEEVVVAARKPSFFKVCSATATCNDTTGGTVSCQFTGSGGTCSFVNQNCDNGVRGHVNCNGSVTQCPQCPCGTPACCTCAATGDCFACCRCDGGGPRVCTMECGGGLP